MNVRNVDEKSSLQVIVNPRTHATSAVWSIHVMHKGEG